ncbi:luciferin sulfotransferase-like [Lutzomyia longipalpis]|uniref:luciferin sulfotransferase-like n=1 Tax=Lutzomyia longipalpis TaxID=7200 RepID=UPI00248464A3|nr:luciferin sulfotransferase-like [Lutzomyia longipalpis]
MSFTFEKLLNEDLVKKAEYFDTQDFVRVHHSRRPDVDLSAKWGHQPFFLPSRHVDSVEKIEGFEVRHEDVYVLGFPKTGTTWTQEMVYQICNDLIFEREKCAELYERSPYLEWGSIFSFKNNTENMKSIAKLPSPRVIKSHLAAPLLPKGMWTVKPKIVYVGRNIKDTAISYYHLYRNVFGYKKTLEDFLEAFLEDAIIFGPLDAHMSDFWNMKDEENIFFITYEDLKRDLPGMIRKTSSFLGKSLTDQQVKSLADHLSFGNMANNESVNFDGRLDALSTLTKADRDSTFKFMRKGKIGSFREEMTPEMISKYDKWIKERNAEFKRDPELLNILLAQK